MIFLGYYCHQSTRVPERSMLDAELYAPPADWASSGRADEALRRQPTWRGRFHIALQPVEVRRATGGFATEDALYYQARFQADPGSRPLGTNLVDLTKLRRQLRRRKAMLTALLEAETHATLRKELGAGVGAAWEEYLCHEAGHGLGLDVGTKVALDFFRPGGRLAPPLLFGEEHRADLLSLRFALRLLAPERARAVFAFHLLHRFGLMIEELYERGEAAALQPYLLFCVLRRLSAIDVSSGRIALRTPPGRWPELMAALGEEADRELEGGESPLDSALRMARYVKALHTDAAATASYTSICVTTKARLSEAFASHAPRQGRVR